MNLKYMEVSLFEITYKKKLLFHDILIYWDALVSHARDAEAVSDSRTNWIFSMNMLNWFANRTKRLIHELDWSDCSCFSSRLLTDSNDLFSVSLQWTEFILWVRTHREK